MTAAIISDIHGNLEALVEALSFIEKKKVDSIYCLGDIVGYGANPNECVELVRERCKAVVLGNHDSAVSGRTDIRRFNEYARLSVLWTREKLNRENFTYLKGLPYIYKEADVLLVHASASDPESWRYIFSMASAVEEINGIEEEMCFIGHTHKPALYPVEEKPKGNIAYSLKNGVKYLVNVGSIGQPRDGDNRLSFCLYDTNKQNIEFIRLKYDIKQAANKIIRNGLPSFLADRLVNGF
jgi:diadenosine tetraphosphatase ApaH/serine/threonine PP2A family protein phosphatase